MMNNAAGAILVISVLKQHGLSPIRISRLSKIIN